MWYFASLTSKSSKQENRTWRFWTKRTVDVDTLADEDERQTLESIRTSSGNWENCKTSQIMLYQITHPCQNARIVIGEWKSREIISSVAGNWDDTEEDAVDLRIRDPPPQCLAMNTQMHEILIIIKIWYLLLISVGKEITSNCWWILIASVYFFLYFVTNINLQLIFNLLHKIISALIIFYMMNDCYAQSHSDCFPRLVCFYIHLFLIFFSSYLSGCNVTNIWRQSRNPATETL